MPEPLLRCNSLSKTYTVSVLSDVSFELMPGEIHALLGANGAGKSTFCKIIAGLISATSGSMTLQGAPYAPANKQQAEASGVQIVQQELNQIATLTVSENLLFNRLPHVAGWIRQRELAVRARAALDRFGLDDIPLDIPVARLGVGQQQMIEIATALDRECRVLILDEPTAALTHRETQRLFEWLHKLRAQGVGIIYISHRLDEVTELTDRVTMLRDGKHVSTRPTAELSTDAMVSLMTGDELGESFGSISCHVREKVRLRVRDLTRGRMLKNVSFDVHAGERLGIAGLVGSGRTELLRAIFGADTAERGYLQLDDDPQQHRFTSPVHAKRNGLTMVTEDRKQSGLLLTQSITTNTTLASMKRFVTPWLTIDRHREREIANRYRHELDLRCNDVDQTTGTLSGGNQQKVVLAKWLHYGGNVFLFDEPTRGVDIASRQPIYHLFEELAIEGKAIVIVSSDLEELLQTCDRILVLAAGRTTGEFHRDSWSREAIMQASFA